MLEYGISITLVASALDEVAQNRDLIKISSFARPDEYEALTYLRDNLDDCHKEAMDLFNAWRDGFYKSAAAAGVDDVMIKQAIFGIDLHPGLDIPLTMAAYMTPVLGTAMTGADAVRNFGKMFGSNMNWKQRLGYGGLGLLDTGLAALSLIPGAGVIGASAKAGKLGKLLKVFGKPGARLAKTLGKGTELSARASKAMLGAAGSGSGVVGKALRGAGFNPAYKAGKIRNAVRGLFGKAPKSYLNPFERLGQWEALMRTGRGAVTATPGLAGATTGLKGAWGSSMLVDNPAWRRMMAAYMPATLGLGMMADAPGERGTEQRLPQDIGRAAKYTTPLIRSRRRVR
jgi:hypothetical protein